MAGLLNSINIFGWVVDLETSDVLMYFLIAQVLLIVITVLVLGILIWRTRASGAKAVKVEAEKPAKQEEKEDRVLKGISLDLSAVKKDFKVGEAFNCDGLVVNAKYSAKPLNESISDCVVLTEKKLKKLEKRKKTPKCYLLLPDMSTEGKVDVTVTCGDQTATYTISVKNEKKEEVKEVKVNEKKENVVPVETKVEEPKLIEYKVIVTAPNELRELKVGLFERGRQICEAADLEKGIATFRAREGKFSVVLFGVPDGYDVTSDYVSSVCRIGIIRVTESAKTVNEVATIEPAPVEKVEEVTAQEVVEEKVSVEPVPAKVEVSAERYDKSFTARLIQSDDSIKGWYSEIKNELLSYKKVHDRMSWKRESYNSGRSPFARMSFRGETLCLYLPIDPETLAESKFKVENVSENASYIDTPCLYRIKNKKRAKYAAELIAMVAESVGVEKTEREAQDYTLPYEDDAELIEKKLIKCTVKDKNSKAFFEERNAENTEVNTESEEG